MSNERSLGLGKQGRPLLYSDVSVKREIEVRGRRRAGGIPDRQLRPPGSCAPCRVSPARDIALPLVPVPPQTTSTWAYRRFIEHDNSTLEELALRRRMKADPTRDPTRAPTG